MSKKVLIEITVRDGFEFDPRTMHLTAMRTQPREHFGFPEWRVVRDEAQQPSPAMVELPSGADHSAWLNSDDVTALRATEFAANEWADLAISALQWLKNADIGISTAVQGVVNVEVGLKHCRDVSAIAQRKRAATTHPEPARAVPDDDGGQFEYIVYRYRTTGNDRRFKEVARGSTLHETLGALLAPQAPEVKR